MFYDGDWHTELVNALRQAEEGTSTAALLEAFSQLRALLAEHDECRHVVTVRRPIPVVVQANAFVEHIERFLDNEDAALDASEAGYLTLRMPRRGSQDYAQRWVTNELEAGIRDARYALLGARW